VSENNNNKKRSVIPFYEPNKIKVLCEQTSEVNKLVKRFFGLSLILSGLGNIEVDFHF